MAEQAGSVRRLRVVVYGGFNNVQLESLMNQNAKLGFTTMSNSLIGLQFARTATKPVSMRM